MANIYVDPSAVVNGTGSEASPRNIWPTGIGAGDIILLKRGTTLSLTAQISMGAGSDNLVCDYGEASLPRPKITSTASNQGLISVGAAGVTTFQNIHFDNCLNMAANGGVIASGSTGARFANLAIIGCRFTHIGQNAILLNGSNTAEAPSTFSCSYTEFEDIGADCVFGAALDYRFFYNKCTKLSSRTLLGDGVGFINGDPNFVWIHHNYIDHSDVDCKQCIIIDTTTPGTGISLIEDNILIGYGSKDNTPALHTIIISDPVTTIRRNIIYTYGLTCGINYAGDKITDNLFIIGNCASQVVSTIADGIIANNTFYATTALDSTIKAIVMGTGATSTAKIQNNLFVNVPTAINSNVVGVNPTVGNNAYWNVTTPRNGSAGAFAESNAVTTNPLLGPNYLPKIGSPLINTGLSGISGFDAQPLYRHNPPSIGAYEYVGVRGTR